MPPSRTRPPGRGYSPANIALTRGQVPLRLRGKPARIPVINCGAGVGSTAPRGPGPARGGVAALYHSARAASSPVAPYRERGLFIAGAAVLEVRGRVARARLRVVVKRLLRQHGYPPERQAR